MSRDCLFQTNEKGENYPKKEFELLLYLTKMIGDIIYFIMIFYECLVFSNPSYDIGDISFFGCFQNYFESFKNQKPFFPTKLLYIVKRKFKNIPRNKENQNKTKMQRTLRRRTTSSLPFCSA